MKGVGVWMKGLAAAVIGGALSSAAQAAAAGSTKPASLKAAAIAGAALDAGRVPDEISSGEQVGD